MSTIQAPFDAAASLRRGQPAPLPVGLAAAIPRLPRNPAPAPEPDLLSALGAETWGRLDPDLGAALVDALQDQPPDDVERYGAGTFTWEELFDDGLCEDPHALLEGEGWQASVNLYSFLTLTQPPTALFMSLSEGCIDALDASPDIDAAVSSGACTVEEEQGFLLAGSDCRACVEESGQVSSCLAEQQCPAEVPLVGSYLGQWYEWAEAEAIACAPDVRGKILFASRDLPDDGTVPEPWDHFGWKWLCFELRQNLGQMGMTCLGRDMEGEELGDAYGQGLVGRMDWMRTEGSDELEHVGRVTYTRRLHLDDGDTLEHMLLSFGGIGQISTPFIAQDGNGDGLVDDADWGLAGYGGWGFTPTSQRPDGELYARDWLASSTLKMSTTRSGVPINTMNQSRCAEWAGPHDDGSYTCVTNGTPRLPWFMDNHVFPAGEQISIIPLLTVASTGLPDELVPGGFVPHVAGSPALANPSWDDCTWPHSFVPDRMRTEDLAIDWTSPASLDAYTYKFGKDPAQDIRVVMGTPQERGFCPEGG